MARSRPGGRRPIPPLVFLLVLAVLALAVWWKVLKKDETSAAADNQCVAASALSTDPAKAVKEVKLRVYNASETPGLAQQVSTEFGIRGFTIDATANDPAEREITGIGEIRFGPKGELAAQLVLANLPGLTEMLDESRADAVVELALGPSYAGMVPPDQASKAVAELVKTAGGSDRCSGTS